MAFYNVAVLRDLDMHRGKLSSRTVIMYYKVVYTLKFLKGKNSVFNFLNKLFIGRSSQNLIKGILSRGKSRIKYKQGNQNTHYRVKVKGQGNKH